MDRDVWVESSDKNFQGYQVEVNESIKIRWLSFET